MPSVLTDKPPALENTAPHNWIAQHIATLHAARQAFTEAECFERIRRALRKQLRPNDEQYRTRDKVYYKRADCTEWKGPGVVIGQDGVVVLVRHGGTYGRVHRSRLRLMLSRRWWKPWKLNKMKLSSRFLQDKQCYHTTGSVNLSQMETVHMAPSEHADL